MELLVVLIIIISHLEISAQQSTCLSKNNVSAVVHAVSCNFTIKPLIAAPCSTTIRLSKDYASSDTDNSIYMIYGSGWFSQIW